MPTASRFEELILVALQERRTAADLALILFHIDFRAYRDLGQPISGQVYIKTEQGPRPTHFDSVLARIAQREPDLSVFSPAEIDLIWSVIDEFDRSGPPFDLQGFAGWQASDLGEEIPYPAIFVGEARSLTPDETQWAHEAIQDYLERTEPPQDRQAAAL